MMKSSEVKSGRRAQYSLKQSKPEVAAELMIEAGLPVVKQPEPVATAEEEAA